MMNNFVKVVCPNELQFLQPVIIDDLCRIGNLADGGYAMSLSAIKRSEALISLGLGENWSFEKAFSDINSKATIDIYDHTVSFFFFVRKTFNGLAKLILFRESKSNVLARFSRLKDYLSFWVRNPKHSHRQIHMNKESFEKVLSDFSNKTIIGLKVDIEGSEWEILDVIIQNKSRFEFLLIEIHDFDKHVDQLRKFLFDLAGSFLIAHLHANNFELLGSNGFPKVFEITLLRERDVVTTGQPRKELPISGLDAPNAKYRPDYLIKFQ